MIEEYEFRFKKNDFRYSIDIGDLADIGCNPCDIYLEGGKLFARYNLDLLLAVTKEQPPLIFRMSRVKMGRNGRLRAKLLFLSQADADEVRDRWARH